jgi:hypothetical protein
MELLLLGVTVVSLLVAGIMSAAAWRMARDERSRSAARVAMLAAAASEPETAVLSAPKATAVANDASEPIAVGESRSVPPWTPSRVSAFASGRPAAIRDSDPRAETARPPATVARGAIVDDSPRSTTVVGEGFLGTTTTPRSSGGQRGLAVAAVILFAAVVGGGYWTVFGNRSGAAEVSAAGQTGSPLELVSLRHERRGSKLAVTGLVRNPIAGSAVNKLTAVVFLFDQQGGFVTSARADVDFVQLAPGDESPFVVTMDAPANVARYRVSFRNDAGIVPHVDRRGQEPIAPHAVSDNTAAVR